MVLVVFGENGFIVKTNRDIVWSEGLLLGASVVGSFKKKWRPGLVGRPKDYFLFGWSNEFRDRQSGVLRIECGLRICKEAYSNV